MDQQPQTARPARFSIVRLVQIALGLALLAFLVVRAVPTWQGQGDLFALRLGRLGVPMYGLMLMSGAVAGALVSEWEARRRSLEVGHVWNILFWGLILGVTVSRLWYVAGRLDYFGHDPLAIIGIKGGQFAGLRGLTIHGALLGAVVAVLLYAWWQKLNFWTWLDIGTYGFIVGQAVGRWGNFYNQEAYGWRTTLPWGLRIAAQYRMDAVHRVAGVPYILPEYSKLAPGSPSCAPGLACYTNLALYPETTRFHPTFLYEFLWNLAMCAFLLWLARRPGQRLLSGEVFFLYGVLTAVGRFGIEFLRVDSEYVGRFPVAQSVSVGMLVLCGGLLLVRRWRWKKRATGVRRPAE